MTQDKAERLLQLARDEFGDLTPAEEELFQKVASAGVANYSSRIAAENDPAKANEWGPERVLRAKCIAWLCTDAKASKLVTHRGIRVLGASIDKKLDLLLAQMIFPLHFGKCSFLQGIDLRHAKTTFLNLEGSHTGPILADGLKIDECVFLRNGFKATGEVRLLGATIGGDLDCREGRFLNKDGHALSADNASIKGNVFLDEGFQAKGRVSLSRATIGGDLRCEKGRFLNKDNRALNADALKVKSNVYLRNGFRAEGKVSFAVAQVYGAFVWTDVVSPELTTLDLQLAKIGTLWDDQESWPQKGKLVLHGLVYEHLADEAPTDAKSRIDWLSRQGDKHFRPQPYEQLAKVLRKSGHESDAKKILIRKNKDLLRIDRIQVQKSKAHIKLVGMLCRFSPDPDAKCFVVDKHEDCAKINEVKIPEGEDNTQFLALFSELRQNPQLRGTLTKKIKDLVETKGLFEIKEIKTIHKGDKSYERLFGLLRKSDHATDGETILIHKDQKQTKLVGLSFLEKIRHVLLGLLVGFGYRPWRPLWYMLGIILVGWGFFHAGFREGIMVPTNKGPTVSTTDQTPSSQSHLVPNAFIYSLDTFVPLVNLHQAECWMPSPKKSGELCNIKGFSIPISGGFLRVCFWIEILTGWLLTTLFVVGLTGVIRR